MRNLVLAVLLCATLTTAATIAEKTVGMEKAEGFFTYYWDAKAGKVWLEIGRWDTDVLYIASLAAGIGSNDIGLDRGQLGGSQVVRFTRTGPKILLVAQNLGYRALSRDAAERRAVEESFAQSVLAGFEVAAEEGSRALVDATSFFLRDAHGVVGTLRRSQQGVYRLDAARSAFYLPRTKNFPRNTEVEVTLTFAGDEPGPLVRSVTPAPDAITVREHHSFVELPGDGFTPRVFDPRAGFHGPRFFDYATPFTEPVEQRFIARHCLRRKDSSGEPVRPITYYVDRGAPEPIRTALLEGARWWSQAFEAAGFKDAFRAELLPEGADPMDVRYNMIQWVHRSTRGWSYGASVTDPRTGEIIKGHVSLGSLRDRQDYLISEGLLAPYEDGKRNSPEAEAMVLARLRQLSAHEVGHSLGLAHNYIASTAGRASVMDYPAPLAKLNAAGVPDLSDAYAAGIGEWDKVAINWGYREFASGADERKELDSILKKAMDRGLIFLTDQDARPPGSAHPAVHLWDNGTNAVDELDRMMKVRAAALARFGERNIRTGAPMATLEDVLVPLYMGHRYQVEAAAKVVGGLRYTYALRGDGQTPTELIPATEQLRAVEALLKTIQPDALALPEKVMAMIPPRPSGFPRNRELFRVHTGLTFDPLAAAETAASHTAGMLLNAERAARLVEYHARDRRQPGLAAVIDRLLAATWKAARATGYNGEVQRAVDSAVLYHLMVLAANDRAPAQARAIARFSLGELSKSMKTTDPDDLAHFQYAQAQIKRFLDDPKVIPVPRPLDPPDGQPIGTTDEHR